MNEAADFKLKPLSSIETLKKRSTVQSRESVSLTHNQGTTYVSPLSSKIKTYGGELSKDDMG